MKKLFIALVLVCISSASFAQLSWNAKIGMNISNLYGKSVEDSKAKVGMKVGVGAEYAFTDMWSIQPSLFFSTKGAKYSESTGNASASVKVNEMYLELPINAQARFAVTDGINITVAAGPYLAVGVGGKKKVTAETGTFYASSKTKTFGDNGFDRFDFGLGVGLGAEFGRILVGLDGQWGLTKLASYHNAPKNLNFSITLGYKF